MSRLPDFIIIGAAKCGTTSLHSYLQQHPQIYLCSQKETFFFINESVRFKLKPWGAVTEFEDYLAFFEGAPINSIVGEISTNYYAYSESAKLIQNLIPQVKIIAILRDPADRAFSHYSMFVSAGHEKEDFSNFIEKDNRYVTKGFYYSELLPFFEVFEKEQIKVLLFDDLCKNPIGFMQDLFRYVGVDDQFIPDMSKKSRQGGLPKNKTMSSLLTKPNRLRTSVVSILKLFIPLQLRHNIKSSIIQKNTYKAKLSSESRKQLIEIYRSDILKLQDLIGRDLSAWLQ